MLKLDTTSHASPEQTTATLKDALVEVAEDSAKGPNAGGAQILTKSQLDGYRSTTASTNEGG